MRQAEFRTREDGQQKTTCLEVGDEAFPLPCLFSARGELILCKQEARGTSPVASTKSFSSRDSSPIRHQN
jgi:hypothetical protein